MFSKPLSGEARMRVALAIESTLRDQCPEIFQGEQARLQGGWTDLLSHLDDLIEIARHTSAERIEPYLAQILDDICTKCPHQFPSGHCPLRERGLCVLYSHARPVLRAIVAALCELQDEPYRRMHNQPATIHLR